MDLHLFCFGLTPLFTTHIQHIKNYVYRPVPRPSQPYQPPQHDIQHKLV